MLELSNVSNPPTSEVHFKNLNLTLQRGVVNVLLGPTLSGKTPLMRLMAGLDPCVKGTLAIDGKNVTGTSVQKRNVAMVYQQFINYPSLTVYENIASPLRIAGYGLAEIDNRVQQAAALLKLTPYLESLPSNLSGGQQQRTAIARAIVKGADLVLMDEPLGNLDYKLREELRYELPRIIEQSNAIFVYATTEPSEALLLNGNTVTLHNGQVTQNGPTMDVYNYPSSLSSLQTFSDPPVNHIQVNKEGGHFCVGGVPVIPVAAAHNTLPDGRYNIALRPYHGSLKSQGVGEVALGMQLSSSEFTGSESFVHLDFFGAHWNFIATGEITALVGEQVTVYVNPADFFIFNEAGLPLANIALEA
jgi:glycerol transport system ATP-binding protein|tara:strand:+ start:3137 stop:4216 length:1080 start_codon:yes stop_codon:yes gene_type:complete